MLISKGNKTFIVITTILFLLFISIIVKGEIYKSSIEIPNSYNEGFANSENNKLCGVWYTQIIIDNKECSGLFYFYNNNTGEFITTYLHKNKTHKGNFIYGYDDTNGELTIYFCKKIFSYTINFLNDNTFSMLSENNNLEIYTRINTDIFVE